MTSQSSFTRTLLENEEEESRKEFSDMYVFLHYVYLLQQLTQIAEIKTFKTCVIIERAPCFELYVCSRLM